MLRKTEWVPFRCSCKRHVLSDWCKVSCDKGLRAFSNPLPCSPRPYIRLRTQDEQVFALTRRLTETDQVWISQRFAEPCLCWIYIAHHKAAIYIPLQNTVHIWNSRLSPRGIWLWPYKAEVFVTVEGYLYHILNNSLLECHCAAVATNGIRHKNADSYRYKNNFVIWSSTQRRL